MLQFSDVKTATTPSSALDHLKPDPPIEKTDPEEPKEEEEDELVFKLAENLFKTLLPPPRYPLQKLNVVLWNRRQPISQSFYSATIRGRG